MRHLSRFIFAAILSLPIWVGPSIAQALSFAEKAELQAAMQRHLDRQLAGGTYVALDEQTGEVVRLYPVTAHPMILQMDKHFVLCFDFRDGEGKDVPVDFYLTRAEQSFVVFHAAVQNRELLHQLMKAGKVSRVN